MAPADPTPPPARAEQCPVSRRNARVPSSPIPTPTDPADLYPDGRHPGLVPGITVEEQRNRFGVDRLVFGVTGLATLAFIAWGFADTPGMAATAQAVFDWSMVNLGWLYTLSAILVFGFVLYLAFGKTGHIRLGRDGEEPEYSMFSWVAMMFGAGIGVGIFFFGPSEPLYHFDSPPPHTAQAGTVEALHTAMAQSYFHWGLHAWAMYALVGAAIAYSSYRRGRVSLLSQVFRTLLGQRHTEGLAGRVIDSLAIVATVFGTAAALGIAALQIGQGVVIVTGIGEIGNDVLIVIIAALTVAFIASAVSGVSRGIRYLSNANIALTLTAVAFVFVTGPTLFLLNLLPSGLMEYAQNLFSMMGKSLSWGEATVEFQSAWTVFYWAWWIAWTPFVGMFIARISRGRTLRQFLLVVMAVPSSVIVLAFTVFGGTTIWMRRNDTPGITSDLSSQEILFNLFTSLPLGTLTPILIMVILCVFFITSADSASVVMATLSSRGDPTPRKGLVVFWGLTAMGIAVLMLLAGGETALTGLQNLLTITALPFAVVLLFMMWAFHRDLQTDPSTIRDAYAHAAVAKAVRSGLAEHGDDFELAVQAAPAGKGAGEHFDSTSDRVTEWYRRTDEDGNPIAFDYETGTYEDEPDAPGRPQGRADEAADSDGSEPASGRG